LKKPISFCGTAALLCGAALLSGCATGPFANHFSGTGYSCDNGVTVAVKSDGSATLQTGRGAVVLLRDAGGVGPQQAVYSNPQMRFETGLAPGGNGAFLEGLVPNNSARCTRR
jgi:hypothetical protein